MQKPRILPQKVTCTSERLALINGWTLSLVKSLFGCTEADDSTMKNGSHQRETASKILHVEEIILHREQVKPKRITRTLAIIHGAVQK
jgi:hypothetical protein